MIIETDILYWIDSGRVIRARPHGFPWAGERRIPGTVLWEAVELAESDAADLDARRKRVVHREPAELRRIADAPPPKPPWPEDPAELTWAHIVAHRPDLTVRMV